MYQRNWRALCNIEEFPMWLKNPDLFIIVHKDAVSAPVQLDGLLLRIIQTFPLLAVKEFLLNLSTRGVLLVVVFFPTRVLMRGQETFPGAGL